MDFDEFLFRVAISQAPTSQNVKDNLIMIGVIPYQSPKYNPIRIDWNSYSSSPSIIVPQQGYKCKYKKR